MWSQTMIYFSFWYLTYSLRIIVVKQEIYKYQAQNYNSSEILYSITSFLKVNLAKNPLSPGNPESKIK